MPLLYVAFTRTYYHLFRAGATLRTAVPGTFYKFMQVLGIGRAGKLFCGKEIEVSRFCDEDRECLAPDAIKYKFSLFQVFFVLF